MKFKLKFFLPLVFIFLSSCGYQPIYSSKGQNFSIGEIKTFGNKDLVKYLDSQLKRFQDKGGEIYNLEINLDSTKSTIAKDKKGNPSVFGLTVKTEVIYKQIDETDKVKTFTQNTSYNNQDNKFDLKKYEKNLEKQLVDKIIEDFIFFTQSLD